MEKESNKKEIRLVKQDGFALLFSVLISSLLLTIGLSIFSIALKELSISTNTQRSLHAFYAADSGRECVMYYDFKVLNKIPTIEIENLVSGDYNPTISCAGGDVDSSTVGDNPAALVKTTFEPFAILSSEDKGSNTQVSITKQKNVPKDGVMLCGEKPVVCTTVVATGWDSDNGDRVERAIEESY